MYKLSKITVTIVVLFVFFLLLGTVVENQSATERHTPGLLALILFVVIVFSIRSIWESRKNNDNDKIPQGISFQNK